MSKGIVYEYEDGGTYCGEWETDSSHGYGCGTGPGGRGRYEGLWERGGQVSGVYTWPNGMKYLGSWKNNKRDGLGREARDDGTEYCGEFIRGTRGPYGMTRLPSGVYRGSWKNGRQDGEGEEVYLDGGSYRGQYKNGVRSGFGSRSSASYERRSKIQDTTSKTKALTIPIPSMKRTSLVCGMNESSENAPRDSIQIYEGEWQEDKRHGYGVIKCIGSYTYYGQWVSNTRTGYGVLVHENGTKEEGQWQNGQLMVALKRKKLHIKGHLETKVQTAHTQSIQAADTARNKAMLAESRASTAMAKAKMAQAVIVTAEKNALLAREKAEQYKNSIRISEGVKSPMSDINMSLSPTPPTMRSRSGSRAGSNSSDSPLLYSKLTVAVDTNQHGRSPSCDALYSLTANVGSDDSYDDDDEEEEGTSSVHDTDSVPDLAKARRKQYQHNTPIGSRGSGSGSSSTSMADDELRKRNRRFESTESERVLSLSTPPLPTRRKISEGAEKHRRPGKLNNVRRNTSASGDEEYRYELAKRDMIKGRQIDKTTGEIKDFNSDEEAIEEKGKPKPPLQKKGSVAMDLLVKNLNQMANWNKMIAYVNFFLLIFLLVLILVVVMSMYYYQLASFYNNHSPEDQGPTTGFISPIA